MLTLYLTRHGETVENAAGILQGQTPGQLNHTGIQQARQLRGLLSDTHFDALVYSDLKRAVDTAEIINERLGLPLVPCKLFRERDWGEFTGWKVTNIRVKPQDFPPSIENPERLARRAADFISFLIQNFEEGKHILAVGHGYFNRCIVAYMEGKAVHDVPRWGNAEVRIIQIDRNHLPQQKTIINGEVSAD